MGIKKTLLVWWLLLPLLQSFGQGVETQKKFAFPQSVSIEEFARNTENSIEFKTHYHSLNLYYDLYVDNENKDLYKMGYSLRFRKRIVNDSIESYTFQLKDEMGLEKETRMEVEETELDFYRVKDGGKWIPLPVVLDTIFNLYSDLGSMPDSNLFFHNLKLIEKWMNIKANGSIAPFQRLRHIDSLTFDLNKLKSFRPILIGSSLRKRGHIYVDSLYTVKENLPFNRKGKTETPEFFKLNTNFNWLFESSIDNSTFTYLKNNRAVKIKEYEVENKFIEAEAGLDLLKKYEKIVVNRLGLYIKYDSKYKQSIQALQ
jgi:hypothetical protein